MYGLRIPTAELVIGLVVRWTTVPMLSACALWRVARKILQFAAVTCKCNLHSSAMSFHAVCSLTKLFEKASAYKVSSCYASCCICAVWYSITAGCSFINGMKKLKTVPKAKCLKDSNKKAERLLPWRCLADSLSDLSLRLTAWWHVLQTPWLVLVSWHTSWP